MRIELQKPYKSIASLTTEELPGLAVLIGRNGAGKTQLLEAIKDGLAKISGIGVNEIELYDMMSFRMPNTSPANLQASRFAQIGAEAYLQSQPGGKPPVDIAAAIFYQCAGQVERDSGPQARYDFERSLRDEIRRLPDFAVFAVDNQDSPYKRALYEQIVAPLNRGDSGRGGRMSSNQSKNSFNGNRAALLSAAMKLTGKLPHELTHGDFLRASHSEGDTMSNSINEVFTAYKLGQYQWAHDRIEKEHVRFDDLITEYRANYRPPWETLREILSEMRDAAGDTGLFNFNFSDPDDYVLDFGNYRGFTFNADMTNRTTGARYGLDSLSSGESILMTLCLVSFNQYLGRRPPKLLLLDELDAVLHPSMVVALVRTLKTLFVSRGTKVLMTSHSAMTVAALEEADIYRLVRSGGGVEVLHTSKAEAIVELAEGLATVDMGLRIAADHGTKVTILSEGNNTKHLKRWVELNFPEDVRVFEGLEQHSNDDNLLTYGRLLAKMNTNTHFIVVWDCDAAEKANTLRGELPMDAKITPYAFKKLPENTIAQKGIENNYDEEILEPYSTKTTHNDGTLVSRAFPKNSKAAFADHVLREGTPQYFTNYQELHDIVAGILSPTGNPTSNVAPGH